MMPSYSCTIGSSKKDDDKEDDNSPSRFSKFSTPHLPHMPKIPNVSQVIEASHVAEATSSVTHRISEVTQASEVAKEAAKEVVSTVTSFFSKNKNNINTTCQAPKTLSSVNCQFPRLSHTPEVISTADLPSNTTKENDSMFSQADDALSSITSQIPQITQVTEVPNPSKVVSSSTLLSTFKNENSTQFKMPNVLSSVIPNKPNVSEVPTALKAELSSYSSVSNSKKDNTSQFQVPSVLPSVTSRIPKAPVIPNTFEVISTAASLIGTSKEHDNTQNLLAQCSLPQLLKIPQLSQIPQISEVASSVTSHIPHVPETAPSLATSIGARNEVNSTQPLLPIISQPQFLQMPKVPQVPQMPQFADVITSSTPLLGVSGIPKDAATSFLKQILTEYLTSRTQQKAVVGLVLLNLARSSIGISINFIENHTGGYLDGFTFIFEGIRSLLGMLGFMISNAFVLEQVINFWTFGWRNHLASPYNVLDSLVTAITFASSLLPSTINEFASLLAILRLWRLFKRVSSIIPNLSPTRLLPNSYV